MHGLSFSGIVHQGGPSVAQCRLLAREVGGVGGLSVYITLNSGRSACLLMITVIFWCPSMFSNDSTTRLAAVSARPLPLIFVCLLLWCSILGRPS
jgi:hypothetical protein